MMDVLVKAIERTNGWAIVVIVALVLIADGYRRHCEGKMVTLAMDIVKNTVETLLESIHEDISALGRSIDVFIAYPR